MTANPDGNWPGDVCQYQVGLQDVLAGLRPDALDYNCETYPGLVTSCDRKLGAGLIFNAGGGAANKLCDLQDGKRYIVATSRTWRARSSASPRSDGPAASRRWATR
jgi:hypothetical protein